MPDLERQLEYEARGFSRVREELRGWEQLMARDGRVVRAVGLRGWPPETELFIEFEDRGKARVRAWSIWEEDFRPPTDGFEGDPDMMATIIVGAEMLDPFS